MKASGGNPATMNINGRHATDFRGMRIFRGCLTAPLSNCSPQVEHEAVAGPEQPSHSSQVMTQAGHI